MGHTLFPAGDLNEISYDEAKQAIGIAGLQHLEEIFRHLTETLPSLLKFPPIAAAPLPAVSFRYAPSIVARNEAELFGTSMPRFAVRCADQSFGIFNLRRLEHLQQAVGDEWSPRFTSFGQLPGVSRKMFPVRTPAETFRTRRCVGDSLVAAALTELEGIGFRMLKSNLGVPYGEGTALAGVPFVEHIALGGGLCAQAACLMCTLLLHEFSLGVHGAAEITALTVPESQVEFALSGMVPSRIVKYLQSEKVRLASSIETANSKTFKDQTERIEIEGLFAYIRSGLPAILALDASRMGEYLPNEAPPVETILRRNTSASFKGTPGSASSEPVSRAHAVVAVGAIAKHQSADSRDFEFLINDPLRCPMLLASGKQIHLARAYRDKKTPSIENLAPFTFISVRPEEVRFQLLSARSDGNLEHGLFFTSYTLFFSNAWQQLQIPQLFRENILLRLPGLVRLVYLSTNELPSRLMQFSLKLQHDLPPTIRRDLENWVRLHPIKGKWVWIQAVAYERTSVGQAEYASCDEALLLWDAEVSHRGMPAIENLPDDFLIAAFCRKAGERSWETTWTRSLQRDLQTSGLQSAEGKQLSCDDLDTEVGLVESGSPNSRLRPAIISSFSVAGIKRAVQFWPRHSNRQPFACELYTFMRPASGADLFGIRSNTGSDPERRETASEEMARIAKSPSLMEQLAAEVRSNLKCDGDTIPVLALASFIPEVTSRSPHQWQMAVGALECMLKLAIMLHSGAASPMIVEIVAGSRTDGVWEGVADDDSADLNNQLDAWNSKSTYVANRMDLLEGIERLLGCLEHAIASSVSKDNRDKVRIALELEPGPLYLLNSSSSLECIDNAIRERGNEMLDRIVGFNLDIAHWNMSGINPEYISSNLSGPVARRIVHAHLSGHHSRAHLGDAPLCAKTGYGIRRSTAEWIATLDKLSAARSQLAGVNVPICVSLEYEAAKCVDLLMRSAHTLECAICIN